MLSRTILSQGFRIVLVFCVLGAWTHPTNQTSQREQKLSANGSQIAAREANLPLTFERNAGQFQPEIKFAARGSGYSVFLTSTETSLLVAAHSQREPALGRKPHGNGDISEIRMKLVGASLSAVASLDGKLPGKSNYFLGKDPKSWIVGVPQYSRVRLAEIYPGIDLVYYGSQGRLENDFVVRPYTNPETIHIKIKAPDGVHLANNGDLVLAAPQGDVRLSQPRVYQEQAVGRRYIAASYVLQGQGEVSFRIADYDHNRELVIDPILAYGTYLGGANGYGGQEMNGIAVDSAGNAVIVGDTVASTYPLVNPLQPTLKGGTDCFVTKINAEGTALLFSTFLGGSGFDYSSGIALDPQGNIYVSGSTESTDFPTLHPFQAALRGMENAFVTKIKADGSSLLYSTYLGGSGQERGGAIAVDRQSRAYVTGSTTSTDFPVRNAIQSAFGGVEDVFVTKLNTTGNALLYSTYLGGSDQEIDGGIAVDTTNNVYVDGSTSSLDFPIAHAIQPKFGGGFQDCFVTKIRADGRAILYSTYLGGSDQEFASAVAVDSSDNAYVAGGTVSSDFPIVNAFQPTLQGPGGDAFITELNRGGSNFVFSTYFGGSLSDSAATIPVDPAGYIHVAGVTSSKDFPLAHPIQRNISPFQTAFVSKFIPGVRALVYSTYLGVSDSARSLVVDSAGSEYVVGAVYSTRGFPVTPLAYQPSWTGLTGNFVTKIAEPTVAVWPAQKNFGSQAEGTTSPPVNVRITNRGAAVISIYQVYFAGTNPGDFLESTACGSTLAAGAHCIISVTFAPLATGTRNAVLAISTSDTAGLRTVILKGTGI